MSHRPPAAYRMVALLVVAVLAIASVGYLSTARQAEPDVGPLPTHREATPRGLVWNVTDPDAPDRMPVHRLERESRSGGDAVRIAERLGMDPDDVTYDVSRDAYRVEDASRGARLQVAADGSRIVYEARSSGASLADPPRLPRDDEARERAAEHLRAAGLMPADERLGDPPRVLVDETVARCRASGPGDASPASCRQVNLTKSVRYDRRIEGRPVLGAGELHVELGDDGRLVGLVARSIGLRQAPSQATVPFDEALRAAQRGDGALVETRPGACESPENREIDAAYLSYFVPRAEAIGEPWGPSGPWVFPLYTFEATCEAGDEPAGSTWSVRISVPAVG